MKRTFKCLLGVFIILVGTFALTGCGKDNGLVGKWTHGDYVYTFNNDKTGSYEYGSNKMKFTYKDNGKKVSILYDGNTNSNDFEYRIEGKKLIIKDSFGSDVEYIKK